MSENTELIKKFLDTSNTLMEEFRKRAPGSQAHGENVARICSSVANEYGNLREEYLKVAALYHDIGKMFYPLHFIENQNGEYNPHDELNPYMSYHLITRHVSDSVAILAQYEIPAVVLQIVMQHHGNTVVQYFYNRAENQAKGESVDKVAFRYPFCKPDTTEAAILMIVDVIESTARSLHSAGRLDTTETRIAVINDTIDRLADDDQLDNIPFGVIKTIKRVLPRELDALFHKRIDYSNEDEEETKSKKKKGKKPS